MITKPMSHKFLIVGLLLFPLLASALVNQKYLESDIYFGLKKDNGQVISNNEFNKFRNQVIVKKFRSGFTIINAQGSWASKKVGIVSEPSKILIVIYKPTQKNKKQIKSIAKKYKKKFNQESVLVVTKSVSVKFY